MDPYSAVAAHNTCQKLPFGPPLKRRREANRQPYGPPYIVRRSTLKDHTSVLRSLLKCRHRGEIEICANLKTTELRKRVAP